MAHISIDIQDLYKTCFGGNYIIPPEYATVDKGGNRQDVKDEIRMQGDGYSAQITDKYQGRTVMLPVRFFVGNDSDLNLTVPCATIAATRKNVIVRTPVAEREGSVKEQFAAGDWLFAVKGVLTGENGQFPNRDIEKLVEYSRNTRPLQLWNGLSDAVSGGVYKVVVESLEFSETQGKHIRFRPFQMSLESDFIDTLIYERS